MKSERDLAQLLRSIDHRGYPAYKQTKGAWAFSSYVLFIDHVQGDPFASPSSVRIQIPLSTCQFPQAYYQSEAGRIGLEDFLLRRFASKLAQYDFKAKGSGKSGLLSVTRCGQEVYARSACEISEKELTVRFFVGFPAFGRTIQAEELNRILFTFLPQCVHDSLLYATCDKNAMRDAVYLAEDQAFLRQKLKEMSLVAFVADGSILPRKSGISALPMRDAVPFSSPESLRVTISLPHRGDTCGMCIPKGITLIAGGGYHGKSTLLCALQEGVYNHVAGDGREFVITTEDAVKLRAEDGRSVRNVDLSLFINDLPNGKDTVCFSTEDASGSTSQAAGVVEAMEAGASLFLIDEDTSATNFMVRDALMQQVIVKEKEPITPYIARMRQLYEKAGISTILVAGSSGEFFYYADLILKMDCYKTLDITGEVKELLSHRQADPLFIPAWKSPNFAARQYPVRRPSGKGDWNANSSRYSANSNCYSSNSSRYSEEQEESNFFANRAEDRTETSQQRTDRGKRGQSHGSREHAKIRVNGLDAFSLDKETVRVQYLEQLVDSEQCQALALLLREITERQLGRGRTPTQMVREVYQKLEEKGWEAFCGDFVPCGLAKPRIQELFACLNRYRG